MDGRRTCLVGVVALACALAGGTTAIAVPGDNGGQGNHYGQLKHQPPDTVPPVPVVPGPVINEAPLAPSSTVTQTAPSATVPGPAPAGPTPPSAPLLIPGPINKSLALPPPLPKAGTLPPVPPGSRDATSQIVTISAAGPHVLRLIVPAAPVAGRPVSFTIAAQDDRAVGGVSFDFAEPA